MIRIKETSIRFIVSEWHEFIRRTDKNKESSFIRRDKDLKIYRGNKKIGKKREKAKREKKRKTDCCRQSVRTSS